MILFSRVSPSVDEFETLKASLAGETAKIEWKDLQRFFAQGLVRQVSARSDLVDIAAHVAANHDKQVSRYISNGELSTVDDDTAQDWFEHSAVLWAVVVKPWILVQIPSE